MEYAEDADEEGDDTGSGDSDGGDQPLKKMRSNKLEVIWTGQKWYPDCVGMFAGFGNADLQRRPGFAGIARALNSKHSDEICAVHRRTDVVINANHVTSLYNRWVALLRLPHEWRSTPILARLWRDNQMLKVHELGSLKKWRTSGVCMAS